MLLRHSSKLRKPVRLMLCLMVLSGCASGPYQEQTGASPVPMSRQAAEQRLRDVPPGALTLFERATAIMAAGDATDAELRFKSL